jgi:hypothetical protein
MLQLPISAAFRYNCALIRALVKKIKPNVYFTIHFQSVRTGVCGDLGVVGVLDLVWGLVVDPEVGVFGRDPDDGDCDCDGCRAGDDENWD